MKKIDESKIKTDEQGRKTFPASEIGVTLRISDETLEKLRLLRLEDAKARFDLRNERLFFGPAK